MNKKAILISGGIVFLLALILGVVLMAQSVKTVKDQDSSGFHENPKSAQVVDQNTASKVYTSKYLTATLPENWTIREYYDNEGMDEQYSTGGNYKGLTGFAIQYNQKTLVSFKGADGLGGINFCDEIYKFKDTSAQYLSDYENFAKEQTLKPPRVLDLSAKTYQEFKIFSRTVRRINKDIYWKLDESSNSFNSACGIDNEVINFQDLFFGIENDSEVRLYAYHVIFEDSKLSTQEMKVLDELLSSLKFNGKI
jgi:hypothetical protein